MKYLEVVEGLTLFRQNQSGYAGCRGCYFDHDDGAGCSWRKQIEHKEIECIARLYHHDTHEYTTGLFRYIRLERR